MDDVAIIDLPQSRSFDDTGQVLGRIPGMVSPNEDDVVKTGLNPLF